MSSTSHTRSAGPGTESSVGLLADTLYRLSDAARAVNRARTSDAHTLALERYRAQFDACFPNPDQRQGRVEWLVADAREMVKRLSGSRRSHLCLVGEAGRHLRDYVSPDYIPSSLRDSHPPGDGFFDSGDTGLRDQSANSDAREVAQRLRRLAAGEPEDRQPDALPWAPSAERNLLRVVHPTSPYTGPGEPARLLRLLGDWCVRAAEAADPAEWERLLHGTLTERFFVHDRLFAIEGLWLRDAVAAGADSKHAADVYRAATDLVVALHRPELRPPFGPVGEEALIEGELVVVYDEEVRCDPQERPESVLEANRQLADRMNQRVDDVIERLRPIAQLVASTRPTTRPPAALSGRRRHRDVPVLLRGDSEEPLVLGRRVPVLTASERAVVQALVEAALKGKGLSLAELKKKSGYSNPSKVIADLKKKDWKWDRVLQMPGVDRRGGYRIINPVRGKPS